MPGWRPFFIPVWKTAPFLRLLAPFAIGIVCGWYLKWPLHLSGVLLVVCIGLFWWINRSVRRLPLWWSFIQFCCMVVLGVVGQHLHFSANHPHFIGRHYVPGMPVTATISTPPVAKPNSFRAEAYVKIYDSTKGGWRKVTGEIILYFAKDSLPFHLQAGSTVRFLKPLQLITNNGNPGGFNYREYAAFRNLYYQVFLTANDYIVDDISIPKTWRHHLHDARMWIIGQLRKTIPDGQSLGVAEALLTGYREDLDKNLVEEYAGTGVAHIIAISGLHLGMIYGILLGLFSPVNRLRHGSRVSAIVIIIILWIFALLTGAGASVLRSALMFTFLLLGKIIDREGNPYNTLAMSAFFLLLFNPFLLWNVGFQLSYSAVLSIFIFSNPIGRWVQTSNRWINKIWQMLSVTIAAQILTLPFVIYHFHQFPVYFIFSNLVAVPAVGVILYGLIILVVISSLWLSAAQGIGIVLSEGIHWMNQYIRWINRLPFSKIDEIYFTLPQAAVFTLALSLAAAWLLQKNKSALIGCLATLLVFAILRGLQWQHILQQNKIIIYHVPRHTAIDIIVGNRYWFWGDSATCEAGFLRNFHLAPSRIMHQVKPQKEIILDEAPFWFGQVGGKTITILRTDPQIPQDPLPSTDILLISAHLHVNPHKLLSKIPCQLVVADGQMPIYKLSQWQSAADSLHLRFHATALHGAFVMDFPKNH